MYSYCQQAQGQKPSTGDPELLLLFNEYPTNMCLTAATAATAHEEARQRRISIATSTKSSPHMDEKECIDQIESEDIESPGNYNSRSRRTSLNKAERRAEHNAIERARRECLNSKFQQLAEALPNLQNHRRPSKGQIVEKALDWVKQNMSKEDRYQYQIMQLQNENKRLMSQISMAQQEKSKSGIITPPVSSSSPIAAPFPPGLRQQQFPANSTPATSISTDTKMGSRMASYSSDNLNVMYSVGMDWNRHQNDLSVAGPLEYMMPSISSSSSSRFTQQEDDNDSNISNEDIQQAHNAQMMYNDLSTYACKPF
ncbi:uncharacterized protein B0P05DRAFT_538989 [Gilbertella persicaria]|uniref:uncharacterized protein n=1 Tax=Gilbertella persicaria TaxID=101096 RepID=UPI00221E9D79|nr:uncharacterized protein B0P05DRAFT_538989 [Gilbertella persicaria]KAI8082006.1 hypothetical protein B0P05DRAFT_538989 [Gilbertella persicaria]